MAKFKRLNTRCELISGISIAAERELAALSQERLAELINEMGWSINQQTISRWESRSSVLIDKNMVKDMEFVIGREQKKFLSL